MTRTPPDSIDRRVRLMDEIVPRYRKISDPVERNLYEKEICRLLGIDPSAFRRRLAGERTEQKWSKPREPEVKLQATGPLRARDAGQETLLGILAVYPEARSEMVAIGLETIFDQTHLPLAQALLDGVDSDESGDFRWSRVFSKLESDEQRELAARLLMNDRHLADMDWRAALRQCLHKQKKSFTGELKQLSLQLKTLSEESPEYQELLKRAEELRNRKSALQ